MIEIRYSAPNELDIVGSVAELQMMRGEILGLVNSAYSQITFDADSSIDPAPYDFALSKLVIVKGECPTRVSLTNENEIHIEGWPHCLEAFASFFDFQPGDVKGDHWHYEYYEGNDWIAEDSIPLVIDVK